MKVCIFADIHGNGPAFRKAYTMLISEKANLNIFLGDLCGYYFDQQEIFEMLLNIPKLIAVRGNHDDIYLKIAAGDKELRQQYLKKYGRSMENLIANKNHALGKWLSSQPDSYNDPDLGISAYHGSPWSTMDGYVYPDSPLEGFLEHPSSVFMLGHTHYPMTRKINDKLVINPGSLGQPRNGGWPTYAVMDHPENTVIFKEVIYDKTELIKQIDTAGDNNPYLKSVLQRGHAGG